MITKEQLAYAVANLHATTWRGITINFVLRDTLAEIDRLDSQTLVAEYEELLSQTLRLPFDHLTYEETAAQLHDLAQAEYADETNVEPVTNATAHVADSLAAIYDRLTERWWAHA